MSEYGWLLATTLIAFASARPYAGGWNDGSRFAAVESLAERGTFIIDDSVFIKVPPVSPGQPLPYTTDFPSLQTTGTLDKLFIDGHYYSDKSPVPSVLMAALYKLWLVLGGPTAAERPDWFCFYLTVATSGVAYILSVFCIHRLGHVLGLNGRRHFLFTFAFAFATTAPAYTRHVNAHILFLAVASGICLVMSRPVPVPVTLRCHWWRVLIVGTLTGFGYTLDLGIGPALVVSIVPFAFAVYRRYALVGILVMGMMPWLFAHHWLNYQVGGTIIPANAVKEYLQWPGSPFTERVMTGGWKHTPLGFVMYVADLLVGKKGFFLHNLPLILTPAATILVWRAYSRHRLVIAFIGGWFAIGVLLYAATSTNLSGNCPSVRWFVPYLAPGFWLTGLLLLQRPQYWPDFTWLTGWGLLLAAFMWSAGTWMPRMVPGLWIWVAIAGIGWGVIHWNRVQSQTVPAR